MDKKITSSLINYYDDEFDYVIAEAIEKFALCNIRFRSPNRNIETTQQKKTQKLERETF